MTDLDETNLQPSLANRELAIGSVFAERFEILSTLGQGGTAIVYKARQMPMDRIVALKVLHSWLLAKKSAQQRFQLEAKALCGLNHPSIVKIYTYGADGDKCFLAMDFLQGQSIADFLRHSSTFSYEEAVSITIAAADALNSAHARGIIHRDIKPSNIMLVEANGTRLVKILDFGLAKILNQDNSQKVTATDHVVGTPYYMSPEQCAQQPLDCRSDIYSLGCVLQEMITGRSPFAGDSAFAVMYDHLNGKPAPLPAEIPTWLRSIIERMLARDPADRFQTMEEVSLSLQKKSAPHSVSRTGQQTTADGKATRQYQTIVIGLIALFVTAGGAMLRDHFSRQHSGKTFSPAKDSVADGSKELQAARAAYTTWSEKQVLSPVGANISDHAAISKLYDNAIRVAEGTPKQLDIEWEAANKLNAFGKKFALRALQSELTPTIRPTITDPAKEILALKETAVRIENVSRQFELVVDESFPLRTEVYKRLALKYLEVSDFLEARKAGKEWLAAEREIPGGIDELGAVGLLFMLPGNPPKKQQKLANELFEGVMKKRSDERSSHAQKALIEHCSQLAVYFANSDPNKTKQCLLRAIELSKSAYGPDNFKTGTQLQQLADHYMQTQQYRAAVPLYEQAVEIFGKTREANQNSVSLEMHCLDYLVWLAQLRRDTAATKVYLEKAISVAPLSSTAKPVEIERRIFQNEIQLADTLILEHKFADAKKLLDRLVPSLEKLDYAQDILGKAYNSTGNLLEVTGDKACKSWRLKSYHHFKELNEKNEDAGFACDKLADLSEQEGDLEAAVRYKEEGFKLAKLLPAHQHDLPGHQLRLNNLRAALRAKEKP